LVSSSQGDQGYVNASGRSNSLLRGLLVAAGLQGAFAVTIACGLPLATAAPVAAAPIDYDIVYVRQPRYGNNTNTTWPEVFHPAANDPGADLMLLTRTAARSFWSPAASAR
jgi:hypothetical protein